MIIIKKKKKREEEKRKRKRRKEKKVGFFLEGQLNCWSKSFSLRIDVTSWIFKKIFERSISSFSYIPIGTYLSRNREERKSIFTWSRSIDRDRSALAINFPHLYEAVSLVRYLFSIGHSKISVRDNIVHLSFLLFLSLSHVTFCI